MLKLSILKFIYFTFFESEKLSDDFVDYNKEFLEFVEYEKERFDNMTSHTQDYPIYLETFLKILNCYTRNYINTSS